MSINYVSLIERAERLPSLEILMKLAEALGTTIAVLVEETPVEDPWLAETGAILRALPAEARPMVLGILRGAAEATTPQRPEASGVRTKRRRKKAATARAARPGIESYRNPEPLPEHASGLLYSCATPIR